MRVGLRGLERLLAAVRDARHPFPPRCDTHHRGIYRCRVRISANVRGRDAGSVRGDPDLLLRLDLGGHVLDRRCLLLALRGLAARTLALELGLDL